MSEKAIMMPVAPYICEKMRMGNLFLCYILKKTRPLIRPPFRCYIYEPKHSGGMGKVIGEFVCDNICIVDPKNEIQMITGEILTGIPVQSIRIYANKRSIYGFRISDLSLYADALNIEMFSKYGFDHIVPMERIGGDWVYCFKVPEFLTKELNIR